MNVLRGVVRSQAFGGCTEDELRDQLSDQGVSDIRRIKVKRDGQLVTTNTYILTFQKHTLPRTISLTSWHHEIVEPYHERPQQCFRCQRYGHVAKYCRSENETSARCGELDHKKFDCTNQLCCFHCGQAHYANDRECPKYKIENEVLATQIKEKISRPEALTMVMERSPDHEVLYSSVLKRPRLQLEANKKRFTGNQTTIENLTPDTPTDANQTTTDKYPAHQLRTQAQHQHRVLAINVRE
jgi:hypothetical protein